MKKIIVLAAVAMAALFVQAASLDWKYTTTAADLDKTVYVMLGDTAQANWESIDALAAESVGNAKVTKVGRNGYAATSTVTGSNITKSDASVYYVIVSKDNSSYDVTSVADMTASVYDPGNQETSPGLNDSLSSSNITVSGKSFGGGGDVPEPTSGLLLLVGGAMLALRRRRA